MSIKMKLKPVTSADATKNKEALKRAGDRTQRRVELSVLLVMVVGLVYGTSRFFNYMMVGESRVAQKQMFQGVRHFEKEDFEKALNGTEQNPGLLKLLEEHPQSEDGKLAKIYVGSIYMQQGQYDLAIEHLKRFKYKDYVMQARAWALIGDALSQQKKYKEAANYYSKAADSKPNKAFTPSNLTKAALAYEADGNLPEALKCYQRIVADFPKSEHYDDAYKHVARLNKA